MYKVIFSVAALFNLLYLATSENDGRHVNATASATSAGSIVPSVAPTDHINDCDNYNCGDSPSIQPSSMPVDQFTWTMLASTDVSSTWVDSRNETRIENDNNDENSEDSLTFWWNDGTTMAVAVLGSLVVLLTCIVSFVACVAYSTSKTNVKLTNQLRQSMIDAKNKEQKKPLFEGQTPNDKNDNNMVDKNGDNIENENENNSDDDVINIALETYAVTAGGNGNDNKQNAIRNGIENENENENDNSIGNEGCQNMEGAQLHSQNAKNEANFSEQLHNDLVASQLQQDDLLLHMSTDNGDNHANNRDNVNEPQIDDNANSDKLESESHFL